MLVHTTVAAAVKVLFIGKAFIVKLDAEVPVPALLVTETTPVVPVAIVATICVADKDVMAATAVPPMVTLLAVTPLKLVPLMVIVPPGQALEVANDVILGTPCTVVILLTLVVPHVEVLKCTYKSLVEVVVTVTLEAPKPKTEPFDEPIRTVIIELALFKIGRAHV